MSLRTLIDTAWTVEQGVAGVVDHRAELEAFFTDRLRVMLRDKGYTAQETDAVLALRPEMLRELTKRLDAVRSFMALPEAEALTAANKRIGNILKKAEGEIPVEVRADLLSEAAEKALCEAVEKAEPGVAVDLEAGRYEAMLTSLAALRAPVDAFFEDVMVNVDDAAVRANRLALLKRLYALMNRVAEIARLAK